MASALLDEARAAGDGPAASTALRAQGLARRELGDLVAARARLSEAGAVVDAGARAAALARGSLASVLAAGGEISDALSHLDAAAEALAGTRDLALVEMQRADVLQRLGRQTEATTAFARAIGAAHASGDARTEALARGNRSILLTYVGRFDEADADLEVAEALFRELDMQLFAADCRHNRGFVAARRGDVVTALARFDEARAAHEGLGVERAVAWLDECEVLLGALLAPEARELAASAEAHLASNQQWADAAEAALLLARAGEVDGDAEGASVAAKRAAAAFADQGRTAWQGLAELVELRVAGRAETAPAALALSGRFDALGWVSEAVEAALLAGRLALDGGGAPPLAGRALARASAEGRGHPLARVRVLGWWAEALARRADGDVAGAMAAARRGVTAATDAAAVLPARELRSAATGHGAGVAALGLELAWSTGGPATVLHWAEALRATSLALPPTRPPADAELEADLAALRAATRDAEDAALAGTLELADALTDQARLERRVLRRSRRLRSSVPSSARPAGLAALGVGVVADHLRGRALVELVDVAGRLGAVVVRGGGRAGRARARLVPLCATAEAAAEVASLRFALGRAVSSGTRPSSTEASSAAAEGAATRLGELVLGPIRSTIDASPDGIVVVPTGVLHGVPWGVLPALRDVPVSVAPSARSWLAATERVSTADGSLGPVAIVGGPDIPDVDDELEAVAACYPRAEVLRGPAASASATLEVLGRADVAHLATHGRFRGDSPMFSSLALHDGPLTVHDLEGLPEAPRVVVLSACEVGRSEVRPGDEVQGVVSVLLGLGASTLLASVLPVPHQLACDVTVGFHRQLVSGLRPAAALAGAVPPGVPSPFVVFGSG